MPRRPRPATRKPPKTALNATEKADTTKSSLKAKRDEEQEDASGDGGGFFDLPKPARPAPIQASRALKPSLKRKRDQEEEDEVSTDDDGFFDLPNGAAADDNSGEEDSDDDEEGLRVAQYEDDDMTDAESLAESEEEIDEEEQLRKLQNGLTSVPLGVLAKARQKLAPPEEDDSASDSDEHSAPSEFAGPSTEKSKKKEKKEIKHRAHKHAPMEMTSKKPVTRRRQVVEMSSVAPRDPRFTSLSGELSLPHIRQNYAFLPTLQSSELSTLRIALSTARKRLPSTPRPSRPAAEEEIRKLEAAVKRAESTLEAVTRERREADVLRKLRKEEMKKRKEGKGEWWLKRGEQKKVLLEAKFQHVREEGGARGVRKVIERRKKKVGQREKRSRPFGKGEGMVLAGVGSGVRGAGVGRGGGAGRGAPRGRGGASRGAFAAVGARGGAFRGGGRGVPAGRGAGGSPHRGSWGGARGGSIFNTSRGHAPNGPPAKRRRME